MANNDILCLTSSNFESNIRTSWQQFQIQQMFCDVTLACDGGQIQAHKIIVSHSSLVLKDILTQTSNQHPIIYLKGIQFKCLESLINFMYQGEISVHKKDTEKFFELAKDLKVYGLPAEIVIPTAELSDNYKKEHSKNSSEENHKKSNKGLPKNIDKHLTLFNRDYDSRTLLGESENELFESINLKISESQENAKTIIINNETQIAQNLDSTSGEKNFTCNMCDKQYNIAESLRYHKKSAHAGQIYHCEQCNGLSFTSSKSFKAHKALVHEVKYYCDLCDILPFAKALILKQHKASVHEGVRYFCDQCDASTFTTSSGLNAHKVKVHEGVRYYCDICDALPFKSTYNLKQHKASIHEGVRYPCDQCDNSTFSALTNLKAHKAAEHEGVVYPCDKCDVRPFKESKRLKQHKNSEHLGLRYPCDQCDIKPFKEQTGLKYHISTVHEEIYYPCNKYYYKGKCKKRLQQHTKKFHNILEVTK